MWSDLVHICIKKRYFEPLTGIWPDFVQIGIKKPLAGSGQIWHKFVLKSAILKPLAGSGQIWYKFVVNGAILKRPNQNHSLKGRIHCTEPHREEGDLVARPGVSHEHIIRYRMFSSIC